ncbi:hypothetical protein [Actinomadura rifamycini]|uniref:hypothetical protein n=1 Tax=Actinomadura rifamycini TaxID=31962 RepID=UPI0004007307|nr:hypothetical protein [Actinomadura rifamycini]
MKRSGGTARPSRVLLARRPARAAVLLAACAAVLLTLTACGETATRQSFTDEHGRACAYVLIEEPGGDKDVGDIDCDFPPGHVPSPAPTG